MPVTLAPKTPAFAKGRMLPLNAASRLRTFHLTILLAKVSGPIVPGSRSPCRVVAPPLADALADLLGIEAHQLHERLMTEQQDRQGIDALHPEQRFHAVEQDVLHEGDDLVMDGGAVRLLQQTHHANGLQKMKEIIQQRPFIEPIDSVHQLFLLQAASYTGVVAPGSLPTQPLRQVLRHLIVRLPHGPPSSLVCLPALEESGPPIKVFGLCWNFKKIYVRLDRSSPAHYT
jgi:hypothetical protein